MEVQRVQFIDKVSIDISVNVQRQVFTVPKPVDIPQMTSSLMCQM